MKNIMCLLGYHQWSGWTYGYPAFLGAERECVKCGRKEIYTTDLINGTYFWYRLR